MVYVEINLLTVYTVHIAGGTVVASVFLCVCLLFLMISQKTDAARITKQMFHN